MNSVYEKYIIRNRQKEVIGFNLELWGLSDRDSDIDGLYRKFGVNEKGKITTMPRNLFIGSFEKVLDLDGDNNPISVNYMVFDSKMGEEMEFSKDHKLGKRNTTLEEKQGFLERQLIKLRGSLAYGYSSDEFVLTSWTSSDFIVLSTGYTDFFAKLENAFLENKISISRNLPYGDLKIGIYSELTKLQ